MCVTMFANYHMFTLVYTQFHVPFDSYFTHLHTTWKNVNVLTCYIKLFKKSIYDRPNPLSDELMEHESAFDACV